MSNFPTIPQDSAKFSERHAEDPAIQTKMEGGYTITRPRFTRRPRRRFTTGFTDLTNAQKLELQAFYDLMKGSSNSFNYSHPVDATVFLVRFEPGSIPAYSYRGMGYTVRWDVSQIMLEEI